METFQIDSLSIIPGSLVIQNTQKEIIPLNKFDINYIQASIQCLNENLKDDSLLLKYRIFPIAFERKNKIENAIKIDTLDSYVIKPSLQNNKNENLFQSKDLDYSGTYTRGVSVGNAQSLNLNSNFNLQLNGMIQDVKITAALTDNNLPFQPEGNTQQIQEFDRIFFELQRKNTKLVLGDHVNLSKKENYFLKFNKKVQGIDLITYNKFSSDLEMENQFNFSIARGVFYRYNLPIQEGNQGPYKLIGANGELYIIIIAGSENVYLDGQKIERGEDRDYIIDYNLGEIKFTNKTFVRTESRIVVEYQYTFRSYNRSIITANQNLQYKNFKANVAYYREHDNKNQPIDNTLNVQKVTRLENIGDDLSQAFINSIDSTGFFIEKINYELKDTILFGVAYDSILTYSTQSSLALYQATFIFRGIGNGNYVKDESIANGNVYKWIAPIGGIPQGEYEPISFLVPSTSHQLLSANISYDNEKGRKTTIENAWSSFDKNTFSPLQDDDNMNTALFVQHQERFLLSKDSQWTLEPSAYFNYIQEKFKEVEPFRVVEFNRDWSINSINTNYDQSLIGSKILLNKNSNFKSKFSVEKFQSKLLKYDAFKENIEVKIKTRKWNSQLYASYLNGNDSLSKKQFFRPSAFLEYQLNKDFLLGAKYNQETNIVKTLQSDSVQLPSFSFFINSIYGKYTKKDFTYKNEFIHRLDKNVNNFALLSSSRILESIQSLQWDKKNFNIQGNFHFRNFKVLDSVFTNLKNKNSVLGDVNIQSFWLKKSIQSQTYYQINNGQEQKVEYRFIKVNPGLGQYIWLDSLFNNNGVQELNEFIIPSKDFQFQADYLRILTPTNSYIQISQIQFNQILNIEPKKLFDNKKSFLQKNISKLNDQFLVQYNSKTSDNNNFKNYLPFLTPIQDTSVQSQSILIRNTLAWNASHPVYTISYNRLYTTDRVLLFSGIEARENNLHSIKTRFTVNKTWTLLAEVLKETKYYNSSAWNNRNFNIDIYESSLESQLFFKQKIKFQTIYNFSNRKNWIQYGGEFAQQNKIQLKARYNIKDQGSLQSEFSFVHMRYLGDENSVVSYTILDGLQRGSNYLWTIGIDKRIFKNLMLNITYDGRKISNNKVTHVGRMQVSAIF